MIRNSVFAGSFYPENAVALRQELNRFLGESNISNTKDIKAIVSPHAGYMYSGGVAGLVYRLLKGSPTRHVLVLGPSHHVPFEGMAISSATGFRTPLGDMRIDPDLRAIAQTMTSVVEYDHAHSREHSIEVQLPFLQTVLPECFILPVVVGLCDATQVSTLIQRCVLQIPEMLVVVSSDLSHYLSYADCQAVDTGTAKQICELDASIEPLQACGAYPLNGLLSACKVLHWNVELVSLKNSGDTAGDKNSVVGYGGFIARTEA